MIPAVQNVFLMVRWDLVCKLLAAKGGIPPHLRARPMARGEWLVHVSVLGAIGAIATAVLLRLL